MTNDLIQICMVGTLVRRLELVKRPDLILVDECHHQSSPTYRKIANYWGSVPKIGWTATPERLDGKGLGQDFDSLILGPTPKWLVDEGWLAMPVLYRPPGALEAKYHIVRGEVSQSEQSAFMAQPAIVGDVIGHYRTHFDGAPVIASCDSVENARLYADEFCKAGYRARPVWGDMPDLDRASALDGLKTGEVQIVTFCDLIGEGVDIPAVSGVIMLRRTMSLGLYLQIVGRALRPIYAEGHDLTTVEGRRAAQLAGPKPRAIILDHVGNSFDSLHGHPLLDREWTLADRPKRAKDQNKPMTTACPKCYGVWPGKPHKCPACGFEFKIDMARAVKDIKVIAGELVAAGIEDEHADATAAFVHAALRADAKTRQKMLIGRAFALAVDGDKGLQILGALAGAVGYKDGFTRWAWDYAQKNRKRGQ